jgi:hypothetical protein
VGVPAAEADSAMARREAAGVQGEEGGAVKEKPRQQREWCLY